MQNSQFLSIRWRKILLFTFLLPAYPLIVLIIAYFALRLPTPPYQSQFQGLIIAHRGASAYAPENTLSAIALAAEMGADAVEIDVQLTKDQVLVAFHDALVHRTTNGTGFVYEKTLAELQMLDPTFHHSNFPAEKPPTIAEVIELTEKLGLVVELDIKADHPDVTAIVEAILALYAKYDIYERVYISSFSPVITYKARRDNPNIIIGHSIYNQYGSPMLDFLFQSRILPSFLGASIVEPDINLVTESYIEKWTSLEYALNVWTINDLKKKMWLRQMGVSYTTDCPKADCD